MDIDWIFVKSIIIPALIGFGLCFKVIYDLLKDNKNKKIENKKKYEVKAKFLGIEKVSKQITHLENKIIKDQFRIIKEISDIMYSEFLKLYIKKLKIKKGSLKQLVVKTKLDDFRIKTDEFMTQVVYHNGIAEKTESDWIKYKERKIQWIFSEIKDYAEKTHKEKLVGMPYQEFANLVLNDVKKIYDYHINILFQDIRTISVEIKNDINSLNRILNKLTNSEN
jgi:hypothetical protein